MDRIDRLESWQAIYDLSCDYMRGQDRLDPVLHRSVFHDDATLDYGAGYRGGPDGFVAFAQNVLRPHAANHHLIGQVRIEFDGDHVAFGEVYYQAQHRVGDEDLFVAGRYVDRYERRDAKWKIAHRTELADWVRSVPAADAALGLPPGARAPDDLSCKREEMRTR